MYMLLMNAEQGFQIKSCQRNLPTSPKLMTKIKHRLWRCGRICCYTITPISARRIINIEIAIVRVIVVLVVVVTVVTHRFALSSSSLSPHLLGRYSVELELRPSGHQTNQLGWPAWGLQPAPGKSNTGLPFPPGCVCVCVCLSVSCVHYYNFHECVCGCACGLECLHKGDVPT